MNVSGANFESDALDERDRRHTRSEITDHIAIVDRRRSETDAGAVAPAVRAGVPARDARDDGRTGPGTPLTCTRQSRQAEPGGSGHSAALSAPSWSPSRPDSRQDGRRLAWRQQVKGTRMAAPISRKRTQRLRRYWDKHARTYDTQIAFWERRLFADGRQWVCSQATGEVLEVAIGTGRNLPHYPETVRLTGIEFSPAMLDIARRRADELGLKADLRLGDAQALDLPDASFDTVLCTLSLCAIPDDRQAVAEMRRVLRPGGRLLLLAHVAGAPRWVRAVQWLLERLTVPLQGEYLRRRPLRQVQAEGFEVERHERTKLGIVERLTARKPANPP